MTLYSFILTVHIVTATSLIGAVLFADHLAFAWLRGKRATLPKKTMGYIHRGMYIGLGIMIVTGVYMFLPIREYLLYETAFQIKMGFLGALLLNSVVIGKLLHISTTHTFTSLSRKTQCIFLLSGGASGASWFSVIVAANLLGV